MKRFISILLALVICVSLVACGNSSNSNNNSSGEKTESAFDVSKEAYDKIDVAYEIIEKYGSDIYEAWRLGIYDDDELTRNGESHLASELSLSEEEIITAIAYIVAGDDEEADVSAMREDTANLFFRYYEDELFTFCVMVVCKAYEVNGKVEEAQDALDSAKELMKKMSEKYSDYEHYPNLKGYYTTTKSFLEFCENPRGSFEQVKDTINDYRNAARDYVSDLDYIFEE